MLKRLFLFFAFLAMLSSYSSAETFNVDNENDYKEVIKLAEKSEKKLIIMFTSDNCSWCKKQKEVLSEKNVSKELEKYVVAYVNVSKNKAMAKKYNVSSVPKCVMIDKDEKVLKELNGYKKDFLNWLK